METGFISGASADSFADHSRADSLPEGPLGALVRTTLVDFPGRVAAALFLHRCNLRCPYCYNADLVTGTFDLYEPVTAKDVFDHLEKRKNVISGFVVSGGEPTIFPALGVLIRRAKELGYAVKLDTNGTLPDRVRELCADDSTRPDFLAVDFKTLPERYAQLGGNAGTPERISETLAFLRGAGSSILKEFRTVLVPGLVGRAEIEGMAALLPPDASWKFAQFRPGSCVDPSWNTITPYTAAEAADLVSFARSFVPGAELR